MSKKNDYLWQDKSHFMWFPIRPDRYFINNGKLYCIHGILNLKEHECQLYRILDISLERKFLNRIYGTGTVVLRTSDSSDPFLKLRNIKKSREIKDMISEMVEEARTSKGLSEREVKATSGKLEDINGDGRVDINEFM